MAERRLHDAEFRGGPGEAALAGDRHERQQVVEILVCHGLDYSWPMSINASELPWLIECRRRAYVWPRTALAIAADNIKEAQMQIRQAGSQPSVRAPAEYFTGTVRIDPLFPAIEPSRVAGNHVTFEPGARTAWHTHPFGQTLVVTSG